MRSPTAANWNNPSCCCGSCVVALTDGRPPRASSSCSRAVRILARAFDHRGRQPGETGHLDSVAAVGAPRDDLAKEHDLVVPLARGDVVVHDARHRIGQIGQLVIVRGEEGLWARTCLGREVFGHGPRDAEPVERGGAAADLVEHDEASRGGEVEDARRLLHLHHEGGLPPRDVVGRTHAREDAIHHRQLAPRARHERSCLREQADERGLPQVGGLAAHIRAGQDHELVGRAVQRMSFGTNASRHVRSTTGCRPSTTSNSSPSCTCGLV